MTPRGPIVCDTGPLVSAVNRAEGARHRFAVGILAGAATRVVVPWPVYTEVDLLLRARGHRAAATAFGEALLGGVHALERPTGAELRRSLDLLRRYGELGVDLPDATVVAMAEARGAPVLTWDFRHFRSTVPHRGVAWPLLVQEVELPDP